MSDDRLAQMLEMQAELQLHANPPRDPRAITDPVEKIQFIKDMHIALTDELHEALGETGWKPWTNSWHVNREAYMGELVDAWHFFMNMLLIENITPEEFFEAYREKHNRNKQRWAAEGGYTGLDKCDRCKRSWDDIKTHAHLDPQDALGVEFLGLRVCLHCATGVEMAAGTLVYVR